LTPAFARAARGLVLRGVVFGAAALIVWLAVVHEERVPPPEAPKPGELLDSASQAVLSWWHRPDTLDNGETLALILRRGGLDDGSARDVVAAAATIQDPRRMPKGMTVHFVGDSGTTTPSEIVLGLAIDRQLHVARGTDGVWRATEERLPWTVDTVVVRGAVRSNLYDAFSPATSVLFPGDAHDQLVIRVADVYEYRVTMARSLSTGDSVYVVVERKRGPESATRVSNILAARLFVHGKMIEAFLFPDSAQRPKYYDGDGQSLATRFLRMPIAFAHISSHFNPSRYHPILQIWRAHKGTDYAAVSGTPVRSIGDGRVLRATYNPAGYGNVVDIDHGSIVTRYGHLRAFGPGIHEGVHVVQGQTIGYVGMTGLATAPHLHFEILKGGVQVNPETALERAAGTPLPAASRPAFNGVHTALLALLARPEGVVKVAAGERGRGRAAR
jgi:murein DD-endopeptidase MepM/ murein hydrolase activator NlpD